MGRSGDAREQILRYLTNYQKRNGYAPSMREIGQGVGLRSPATVLYHLKKLEDAGYLTMSDAKSRSIRLTETDRPGVPVVGQVAAGAPILAEENIEGYLPLRDAKYENCFALRVKGYSMKNAGILPKDQLIVRRQATAENGDIVVAMLEGEATVKYWKRTECRDGTVEIRLLPDNPDFEPIDGTHAVILGKVIGVVREY